jgi:hypothetical protein
MNGAATDRMPVEDALRELHGEGLHDGAIAEQLRSLGYGRGWTRRKVCYWRRDRLGLQRNAPAGSRHYQRHALYCRWRVYQTAAGFAHLLPEVEQEEANPRRPYLTDRSPPLKPRDVDLLVLLRDNGPLTARRLALLMGLASHADLTGGGSQRLTRLVRLGLVDATADLPPTYSLSTLSAAPTDPRVTSNERKYG